MEAFKVWSIVNILLGFVALIAIVIDVKRRYKELSRRRLYLTFALGLLVFATIIASLQVVFNATPLGFRTGLYTAACLWCIFGIWLSRDDPS